MLLLCILLLLLLSAACLPAPEWWYEPTIHNLGNIGLKGRIHAHAAEFATRVIDRFAYDRRDIRKEILQQIPSGHTVVDLGCGVGLSTAAGAVGVDTSEEMLAVARSSKPRDRRTFVRANAISFGQDDEFNAATVFYLLHEAPKQGRIDVIRNAIRIAAEAVIIVDISPSSAPPCCRNSSPTLTS